ncbi:bifunctional riboflavin kinase/FMN adenylyltransferase [Bacillus sp. AFS076308]|uniref:FAD synthetase family protein n=1 Tax=unclassified Bacillus (in: firmicutes) TaxID=185979 RepID=UPI000BF29DD9|nr:MULTISPECIES: FAD synthetase family protein [unclassified Bacillus (in: firmicutes)]PFN99621.1 bifunctional riboflavin kinase/FMN adenylyltransferase [Bacillus sp. AFS076308]PGV50201.1 bifunctional riboflavin kinase/FMN adenylyltransferase [Bacillus sp. AFS037270]
METIRLNRSNLAEWQRKARPNVMALGCFDGLHHGHCAVINTAFQKANEKQVPLAVMSFFPHPKTVISNGKIHVHYLMPLAEKEAKLRKMGVDTFYIVEFDKDFAGLAPEQFAAQYLNGLGVVHAVAGFDFSYGARGAGNMNRLKSDSGGRIDVTKVAKVELRGEKISSSCIRERLLNGKVAELPDLLGQFYETQCEWNGERFILYPYYTLPGPGRYQVLLNNLSGSVQTEVIVMNDGTTLQCTDEIPYRGKLSIVWKKQIVEARKLLIS